MINWYMNLNYPIQALIASLFTWGITSLGAAVVFLFKKVNKNTMDAMLGLSAGVMLAATFWSLLSPALEMAENLKLISWLIVSLGVYLIHMNQHVAQELWGHWIHVSHVYSGSSVLLFWHMLITVLGIFLACVLFDWLRLRLFQLLAPWGHSIWDFFAGKIRLLGR